MRKFKEPETQLSLFENTEITISKEPSVLEFIRARFENGQDMTHEEYKRWIKILVNSSFKSID